MLNNIISVTSPMTVKIRCCGFKCNAEAEETVDVSWFVVTISADDGETAIWQPDLTTINFTGWEKACGYWRCPLCQYETQKPRKRKCK